MLRAALFSLAVLAAPAAEPAKPATNTLDPVCKMAVTPKSMTATVRGQDNPAWCKKGSSNEYAKVFPIEKSTRQVAVLDPKTMKYSFVDTCFGTHHPQFGFDKDNTLWLSGTGQVAGWVNTRVFDETGDPQKAVGWAPFVLDINGNGKLDDYVEPNQPADANKDKRLIAGSGRATPIRTATQ